MILSDQINEIELLIPRHTKVVAAVSKVSVGWHLDHMLKAINVIFNALNKSDPNKYKADSNITRSIVFTAGKFPRGRGKSPKSVLPPEIILDEDLYQQLEQAKNSLLAIEVLDKNQYFKHALFGTLNKAKTKRFIEIHTNHHLRIVRDIVSRIQ